MSIYEGVSIYTIGGILSNKKKKPPAQAPTKLHQINVSSSDNGISDTLRAPVHSIITNRGARPCCRHRRKRGTKEDTFIFNNRRYCGKRRRQAHSRRACTPVGWIQSPRGRARCHDIAIQSEDGSRILDLRDLPQKGDPKSGLKEHGTIDRSRMYLRRGLGGQTY